MRFSGLRAIGAHETLRLAARYGIMLGALNSVFAVLNLFFPVLASPDALLSVVAGLALLTLVGMEAGRKRGAATPALFVGTLAGATAWAVNALVDVGLTLIFVARYREQALALAQSEHHALASLSTGRVIAGNFLLIVFYLFVAVAFGAVLGGLGGLIGRHQARQRAATVALGSAPPPTSPFAAPPSVSPATPHAAPPARAQRQPKPAESM